LARQPQAARVKFDFVDETSEAVLRQREQYLQEIRKVLGQESDRIGRHLIDLGLFRHEPPSDVQLLLRILNPLQASFDGVPPNWRPLSAYRPHSYSDSDLKETRIRQERKRMLRRKDSTCSSIQPNPLSRSLPASPLLGPDQRRSGSDLACRSGGLAQPQADNAEQPLFDTQINRELMFLDGLILDPKRLFGRKHSVASVSKEKRSCHHCSCIFLMLLFPTINHIHTY
jgi:hypothetical protein